MRRARPQHLPVRTRCASSTTGQLGSNVGLFAYASGLVREASQQPGRQLQPAAATAPASWSTAQAFYGRQPHAPQAGRHRAACLISCRYTPPLSAPAPTRHHLINGVKGNQ